jgi:hypothetical protein
MNLPGLDESIYEMEEIKKMDAPKNVKIEVLNEIEPLRPNISIRMMNWQDLQNEMEKYKNLKRQLRETKDKIDRLMEEI